MDELKLQTNWNKELEKQNAEKKVIISRNDLEIQKISNYLTMLRKQHQTIRQQVTHAEKQCLVRGRGSLQGQRCGGMQGWRGQPRFYLF